jgi:transcriptional regulator with XRE-family HTH domain
LDRGITLQESLNKFVSRIIREKRMTLAEVELRAGGGISDSYISSIIKGGITNLSIQKLKALARGLGVEEAHLLSAACEIFWPHTSDFYESEFGRLFYKYRSLADSHKRELLTVLAMLDREIERRLLDDTINNKPQREIAEPDSQIVTNP